jgi:hypothetical protein
MKEIIVNPSTYTGLLPNSWSVFKASYCGAGGQSEQQTHGGAWRGNQFSSLLRTMPASHRKSSGPSHTRV